MIGHGTQKKMIVLKRTGSPYFSEAYFILRDGDGIAPSENDMAAEAERIIARMNARRGRESENKRRGKRENALRPALWFSAGAFCGLALAILLSVIFH